MRAQLTVISSPQPTIIHQTGIRVGLARENPGPQSRYPVQILLCSGDKFCLLQTTCVNPPFHLWVYRDKKETTRPLKTSPASHQGQPVVQGVTGLWKAREGKRHSSARSRATGCLNFRVPGIRFSHPALYSGIDILLLLGAGNTAVIKWLVS